MKKYIAMIDGLKIFLICFIIFLIYPFSTYGQWIQQPFPSSEALTKVKFADSNTGWILGENYIYKTSDGGNLWIPQDSTGGEGTALTVLNANTVFYSFVTIPDSIYELHPRGLKRTTNGGITWQIVDTISFLWNDIQFINDQVGYGGGRSLPVSHPMLRKTTDGGSTWFTVWSDTGPYYIEGIHFINTDYGWIVQYNAVILKTTNGGVNWTVSDSIRPYPNSWLPLRDITFITPDSGWIVGGISGDAIIARTTDAGSQWSYQVFSGSSLREVKFFNSNVGWFCGANNFEPFIAKTTNGGETWVTQYQLPFSSNGAESISMIDTNLGWTVNSLGEVYKTTNGGVSFIGGEAANELPTDFVLFQNYPNPFNPTTKIHFEIPLLGGDERGGLVTLNVYDILGNEVAALVNEEKPAGEYEVEFNGSSLSSGVYFYQLKAGTYSETKKMLLLK